MKEKNIPFKNYLLLAGILIVSIVLVIYFYMWYGAYEENRLDTPIMDKYLNIINYNELENYLTENINTIIYASTLNDENTRIFEKQFKSVIDFYSLNSNILYLDLSSEISDESLFNNIKVSYGLKELPCIIIFKNAIVYDVYSIKDNDYNIDNVIAYLKNEGVIND